MAISNLCCRCHEAKRRLTSSYCLPCQRQRQKEYLTNLPPHMKEQKKQQWAEYDKRKKERKLLAKLKHNP
jgi:hypothetical protein